MTLYHFYRKCSHTDNNCKIEQHRIGHQTKFRHPASAVYFLGKKDRSPGTSEHTFSLDTSGTFLCIYDTSFFCRIQHLRTLTCLRKCILIKVCRNLPDCNDKYNHARQHQYQIDQKRHHFSVDRTHNHAFVPAQHRNHTAPVRR